MRIECLVLSEAELSNIHGGMDGGKAGTKASAGSFGPGPRPGGGAGRGLAGEILLEGYKAVQGPNAQAIANNPQYRNKLVAVWTGIMAPSTLPTVIGSWKKENKKG